MAGTQLLSAADVQDQRRENPDRRALTAHSKAYESVRYGGVLKGHFGEIAVELAYASRFSLYAWPLEKSFIPYNTSFEMLLIHTETGEVKFDRCTFTRPKEPKGAQGLLIFHGDIYDFEYLFRDEKLFNLEKSFQNLPMVLAQKAAVTQEFKDFTSEWLYDLNVYKAFFDDLDRQIGHEPKLVQEAARATIIQSEGRKFMQHFSEWLHQLRSVTAGFSAVEHERHGFYFRKQMWHIASTSEFIRRTILKPRGYAGDSEMMSMLYANTFEGDSTFGQLLHKHPLESAAAQAVRNRRALIPQELRAVLRSFDTRPLRIMSVACGPALEISDYLRSGPHELNQYEIALLDQDTEALSEAASAIASVEKEIGGRVAVSYLNESVRTMLRTPALPERLGRFHFIYSMGLFDYLSAPVARNVALKLFDLLAPGGVLLIGNYHVGTSTRTYLEYWMDWVLLYRTEEEMLALLADRESHASQIFFENTRSQMFLRVRRNA